MSRGVRLDGWRQHVQRLHVMVVAVREKLHDLHRLKLLQTGFLGYLVLALVSIVLQVTDIGNVTHIAHLVPEAGQVTEEDIERDSRARMSQMGIAIDRRSADVHTHMSLMQGTERLLRARECVI